ncbi:MAG: hypothetical protein H6711_25175 [Myxococcales bacterium]|nr:hypothetical protein [Myxococcales bacterium]
MRGTPSATEQRLVRFRRRITSAMAIGITVGCVLMAPIRIWQFTVTGDVFRLLGGGVVIFGAVFCAVSLRALIRGELERAGRFLLISMISCMVAVGVVDQPGLALLAMTGGAPMLYILGLALGALERRALWQLFLPVTFGVTLVVRQLVNPIEWLRDPSEFAVIVLCGFVAIYMSCRLADELFLIMREGLRESEEARIEAERANQTKGLFLATMSHELRTPLNVIIGYAELIDELLDDPDVERVEIRRDVERVRGAAEHLLSMIADVLDMSKIEAGQVTICLESVGLPRLVAGLVEHARPLLARRANTLEVVHDPAAVELESDAIKVRQVLLNLLSNAAKFTESGVITLRVVNEARAGVDGVLFAVSDTGIGIPADRIGELFKPFTQVDASTTRLYGGTGLGLAICRSFAERLGGTLTVESELGVGSTFALWLPRRHADAPPPALAEASPA